MKNFLILFSLFIISCHSNENGTGKPAETDSAAVKSTPISEDDYFIVAGKSIGKVSLGMLPATVSDLLGKPDLQDAAMGKAWLTWEGQKDEHHNQTELNIYITYKDSTMESKVVKQIRTTSSAFRTATDVSVNSNYNEIQLHFPDIEKVGTYKEGQREFTIYDDIHGGIAFDIVKAGNEHICTGITVHEAGEKVVLTYLSLHPGLQIEE